MIDDTVVVAGGKAATNTANITLVMKETFNKTKRAKTMAENQQKHRIQGVWR